MRDLRQCLPNVCYCIAYATPDNFAGRPFDGYGAPGAWLRAAAADALCRAVDRLAQDGLSVVIFDAYRPARATAHMWRWAQEVGRVDLFDDGWIARPSRHNRGLAVDLSLVDATTGAWLDMGSPFDAFVPESHVRGVTGAALQRRLVLRAALLAEGFRPLESEWWHFEHPDPTAEILDVPYGADEPAATELSARE